MAEQKIKIDIMEGKNMDWLQVLTIAGSTIGACWIMHRENLGMGKSRDQEMKDFHGRLCTLEERYLQILQRIMEEKNSKKDR
jgi:hypothetical protein